MEGLSAYAAFQKVVETGSFTAAAQALGITKSAVSKHVSRLEDRLGIRLLDRTTRRLRPTEVGAAFHQRISRILSDIEEAEDAAASLQAEPRGTLRVNAPVSFGVRHLGPLLNGFLDSHPGLSVDLVLNDRVVDLIDEGFDMAVRIADLADSSLIARRLAPARRVVCAAPDYWARHGKPRSPEELSGHECLAYSYMPGSREWIFGSGSRAVAGRLTANNGDLLSAAAVAGLGVILSPTFIVGDDLRAGRLETALEEWEGPPLSIHAVYPHNRHLSAKVRAFVDYLIECSGAHPYWDEGIPDMRTAISATKRP